MRKTSDKQAILNRQYTKQRKQYLANNPLCRAKLINCTRIATEVHHKRGRGKFLLDMITWLPVCRSCHEWIENHPKEAKELNLSQSRLIDDS